MKNSFSNQDQHDYLGNRFDWNQLSFGTFYQIIRNEMRQYGYRLKYSNVFKNFEDIYQETMITFYKLRNNKRVQFDTNRQASIMVKRIFKFAIVNDYRREKRHGHMQLPNDDILVNKNEYIEPDILPLYRRVELFFPEVDNYFTQHRGLLNRRQLQFYGLYKERVLKPLTDEEIRLEISTEMMIRPGHYHVLKSQVTEILENLILQPSFVTR